MRIEMDYRVAEGGRPEGTIRVEGDPEGYHFTGVMQLVRFLEDMDAVRRRAAMGQHPARGRETKASQAS